MERIKNINKNMAKPKTLYKQVPKSEETVLQQKIDMLLPNDLHNLEDPSIYLKQKRQAAKVDPDKLRSILISPMNQKIRDSVYTALINDPDYEPKFSCEMGLEEHRNYTNSVFVKTLKALNMTPTDYRRNPDFFLFTMSLLSALHASAATKLGVHYGLYTKSILKLGTQKHQKLADQALELKNLGCFGLTELGHGSNVQGILTTATYKHDERCFILNTPHELGMKYWIGNLAKTCDRAVVFAKLIVDDKDEGIHVFHVPVRNLRGDLLPGVIVGDIGHKLGHNGVDNAWVMFKRVKLPYDAMLDKYSAITEDGKFTSPIKKKMDRFALQLAALSGGRLAVGYTSGTVMMETGMIGLRYLCTRKQFGAKKYQEETLINYPLIQFRLFPILANSVIYNVFIEKIFYDWENLGTSKHDKKFEKEIHALSSFVKVINTWEANKAVLVVRELCGGHGYSSYSKLPDLIQDQNVQVTWEGTNDVLIQQTAKFLMKVFTKYMTKGVLNYKSFQYLKDFEDDERTERELKVIVNTVSEMDSQKMNQKLLLSCIKRIMQYRIKVVSEMVAQRFSKSMELKKEMFSAYNRTLPDALLDACIFYGEYKTFEFFEEFLAKIDNSKTNEREFLTRLLIVFVIDKIKNKNHYLSETCTLEFYKNLDDISLNVNESIVNDLVVLGDVMVLPDELMNSTLGNSDGDVYRRILSKLYSTPGHFGKDKYWRETLKLRGYN